MKYKIYRDALNKWRWFLATADGERLASGEPYSTPDECVAAVACISVAGRAKVEWLTEAEEEI